MLFHYSEPMKFSNKFAPISLQLVTKLTEFHKKERYWRKTRKPFGSCIGTDANRNFDFHWGEIGASSNPCSETFRGKKAFSEPETIALRDLMHSISAQCKFYLTLHSYGQYMLYPWGYTEYDAV